MEDKKISEAVELLFKGAKMLAYHCPQCNMPLFKYEDKVICPICKKEAEIIGEGKNAVVKLKDDEVEEGEDRTPEEPKVSVIKSETDIEATLKQAIQITVKRLVEISSEEKITIIKEYVEVITDLVNLLEKVRCLKI